MLIPFIMPSFLMPVVHRDTAHRKSRLFPHRASVPSLYGRSEAMTNPSTFCWCRASETCSTLSRNCCATEGFAPRQQLNTNGHVDPLHGVEELPDVVILHLSHLWREELESFIARPAERRPALILIGATHDMPVMRLAMQAGARDVLPAPPVNVRCTRSARASGSGSQAVVPARRRRKIAAFINAKGGCGATLLACNVAHMLAVESKKQTALIDLDLQFGAAPLYLDLYPKRGVAQAAENLAGLDEVALDGYFTQHASGLNVLSHAVDDPVNVGNLSAAAADQLISIAARSHDQLIIDLPRRAEPMTGAVISRAHQVVVVLQQSVTALRDAARLLQWLRGDLGVTQGSADDRPQPLRQAGGDHGRGHPEGARRRVSAGPGAQRFPVRVGVRQYRHAAADVCAQRRDHASGSRAAGAAERFVATERRAVCSHALGRVL